MARLPKKFETNIKQIIQLYKTRDIPNKVCIVVVHNLILNCILRFVYDLINYS